jgi:chemotaxis receptor (MCP) glutamine deamidase CheD
MHNSRQVKRNKQLIKNTAKKGVNTQMTAIRRFLSRAMQDKKVKELFRRADKIHLGASDSKLERKFMGTAISLALGDLKIPKTKRGIINKAMQQNELGLITAEELETTLERTLGNQTSSFLTRTIFHLAELDKQLEIEREAHIRRN